MSNFTDDELDRIWQKGIIVDGLDPTVYRTDAVGGLMKRSLYGNEGNLGWEVDHIFPVEKLKAYEIPEVTWDDLVNLRPMNAKNNAAKGEDYPDYKVAVQYNGNKTSPNNIKVDNKSKTVNGKVQERIRKLYLEWWPN